MSESVALFLTINGMQVQGESEQSSLGRAQSIECFHYHQAMSVPSQIGSGQGAARRQYGPLLIRKRIDKASPLIARALVQNSVVDAVFKFFRALQDGTLEQFYTTRIRPARVVGVSQYVPDVLDPATASEPPLEEVTFVFQSIEWTHTSGGVSYQDTWSRDSGSAGYAAADPAGAAAGAAASGAAGAAGGAGGGRASAGTSTFSPDQVLQAAVPGPPSRVAKIVPLTADDKGPEKRLSLTRRDLPREVDDLAPADNRVDVGFAPPYVPVGPLRGEPPTD